MEQRLRCSFFVNRLKDLRQDSPTLWRWNVMSPTTITTSLGNPVVQNLTSTDAQIRDHTTTNHHTGKRTTRAIALLAMLGLWSWPPPPAAPAPAAVAAAAAPEPSLACSSSSPASSNDPLRNRTRQAFLGRNSWTVGFREGEARFTRNNGVLPIYPGVLFRWGGVKDSQVGEDEDKMAFLVF